MYVKMCNLHPCLQQAYMFELRYKYNTVSKTNSKKSQQSTLVSFAVKIIFYHIVWCKNHATEYKYFIKKVAN